jgi:DNA-directed RNA polymerase specialized sigma24 family protein
LTEQTRADPHEFYGELKSEGVELRGILWPLAYLTPRERAVFVEYHYWNTHMKVIAESHRISLGRAYEILYRAEKKIASSRIRSARWWESSLTITCLPP